MALLNAATLLSIVFGYQSQVLRMAPLHNMAYNNIDEFRVSPNYINPDDDRGATEHFRGFNYNKIITRRLNQGAQVVSDPDFTGPFQAGTNVDLREKELEINTPVEALIQFDNNYLQRLGDPEAVIAEGLEDLHNKLVDEMSRRILLKYRASATMVTGSTTTPLFSSTAFAKINDSRELIKNATIEYEGQNQQFMIIPSNLATAARDTNFAASPTSNVVDVMRRNLIGRGELDPSTQFVNMIRDAAVFQDFALTVNAHTPGYIQGGSTSNYTFSNAAVGATSITFGQTNGGSNAVDLKAGDVFWRGNDTTRLYTVTEALELEATTTATTGHQIKFCPALEVAFTGATDKINIMGNTTDSLTPASYRDAFYFERDGLSSFTRLPIGNESITNLTTWQQALSRQFNGIPATGTGDELLRTGIPMIAPRNQFGFVLKARENDYNVISGLHAYTYWNADVMDERRVVRIIHSG